MQPWPPLIKMDAAVKEKVEKLFAGGTATMEKLRGHVTCRIFSTKLAVRGRGFRHDAFCAMPRCFRLKCMFNGSALYRADRAWFAVDMKRDISF